MYVVRREGGRTGGQGEEEREGGRRRGGVVFLVWFSLRPFFEGGEVCFFCGREVFSFFFFEEFFFLATPYLPLKNLPKLQQNFSTN